MRRHLAEETTAHKNDDIWYGIATAGNPDLFKLPIVASKHGAHAAPEWLIPLTREEEQGDA